MLFRLSSSTQCAFSSSAKILFQTGFLLKYPISQRNIRICFWPTLSLTTGKICQIFLLISDVFAIACFAILQISSFSVQYLLFTNTFTGSRRRICETILLTDVFAMTGFYLGLIVIEKEKDVRLLDLYVSHFHTNHNSLLAIIGSGQELKNKRRMSMIRLRPSKAPSPYMQFITCKKIQIYKNQFNMGANNRTKAKTMKK